LTRKLNEKIKQYWEERASVSQDQSATTNDIWLRELEIKTIIETLLELKILDTSNVLDIGCGDGYSTIKIAKRFPQSTFHGIDFSENMIKMANSNLEKENNINLKVKFSVGSVLDLDKLVSSKVDVVISDRCLINLESLNQQQEAIEKIVNVINNGYFIAIENFVEGHENMNQARKKLNLPEIPIRWHNLFFNEADFISIIKKHFKLISLKNFSSSYYFATRIIYSKMCDNNKTEPDYNHEIHKLAIDLPSVGNFSPIRMAILQKI